MLWMIQLGLQEDLTVCCWLKLYAAIPGYDTKKGLQYLSDESLNLIYILEHEIIGFVLLHKNRYMPLVW